MSEHQRTPNEGHKKPLQQQSTTRQQEGQTIHEADGQQSPLDLRRMTPSRMLYLQRTIGNAATQRLLATNAPHSMEPVGDDTQIEQQSKASPAGSKLLRKLSEDVAQENSVESGDTLKSGFEHFSRMSLEDVKLHHSHPAHAPIQATSSRSGIVQRLMSQQDLLEKAGQPKADSMGGLKKKSKRYKSLLATLGAYDKLTTRDVKDDKKVPSAIEKGLNDVQSSSQEFVKRYDGLSGVSAWKNSVERARLPHIKALQIEIKDDEKALGEIPGKPAYRGKSFKDAIRFYKAQELAGSIKKEILRIADLKDAKDGKASIETVRDQILSLEGADVKKLLLGDGELRATIKDKLSKGDALLLASVLLDRALEWWQGSGPDEKEDFQITDKADEQGKRNDFAHWIRSGNEDDASKPDLAMGKMNCWEGVLFSMYVAGVVSYEMLRGMHVQAAREGVEAKTQSEEKMAQDPEYAKHKIVDARFIRQVNQSRGVVEGWFDKEIKDSEKKSAAWQKNVSNQMGVNAYYFRVAENLGAHDAKVWNQGDAPPPAGNIVFFVGTKATEQTQKWTIAHVCISLGRASKEGTDIMNFGVEAQSKTIWGRSTIEGFLKGKYKGYICKFGPATMLNGGLSLKPARGIDKKDELL
jgi:hypothetical protein